MKDDKVQKLNYRKITYFYSTENKKELNFLSMPPYTKMKKLSVMKNNKYQPVLIFHVETDCIPELFFLEGSDCIADVLYVQAGDKAHLEIVLNNNYIGDKLIIFKVIE